MDLLQEAVNVAMEMKKTELDWESFYSLSEGLVKKSIENYEEFFVLLHRYAEEEKYVMLMLIIINGASLNVKFNEVFAKINSSKVLYSILNLIDIKEYYPGLVDDVQLFLNSRKASIEMPTGFKYLLKDIRTAMVYIKDQAANAIIK
jgi:hypothetical protein